MATPSLQTFITDSSQVLNLGSISAVRSVVAVALANANTGTPLNPNLTTQQLWNEFYQVVTEPKSNIESFIANQMMKFLFSPPAPGGAGADKQVIFNDMGVLAGDAGLTYNKTTDTLEVVGNGANGVRVSRTGLPTQFATLSAGATGPTLNASSAIGSLTFGIAGTAATAMTLDSTGLGIGASPAAKLYVYGANVSGIGQFRIDCPAAGVAQQTFAINGVAQGQVYADGAQMVIGSATSTPLLLRTANTVAVTIDASQNVGVGVTPSAWDGNFKALQLGYPNFICGNAGGSTVDIGVNAYYNPDWKYALNSVAATRYRQASGLHIWYNAPNSGASGANTLITWTPAMTLDANGRLGIGTATPSVAFEVKKTGLGSVTSIVLSRTTENAADTQGVVWKSDDLSLNYAGVLGVIDSGTAGSLALQTATGGTLATKVTIDGTGNLSLATGNVVMATSGKGIDFSAVTGGTGTATGNVLNDYEEGTFTPTVTSSGGTGIVYTPVGDTGTYTKIGRLVTFTVNLIGTYTGTFGYIIIALPFTVGSTYDTVSGYNNGAAIALTGRTDSSFARFIVVSPQTSGNLGIYTGSYNV